MKKMKKGFTIVELVIVIGVIAILSAILIPTFVNLTDKANKAKRQTEVSDAYSLYVADAADGVLFNDDESKSDIAVTLVYKQDQVLIEHPDNVKLYSYDDGWTDEGSQTKHTTAKIAGDEASVEYNGCTLYVKA